MEPRKVSKILLKVKESQTSYYYLDYTTGKKIYPGDADWEQAEHTINNKGSVVWEEPEPEEEKPKLLQARTVARSMHLAKAMPNPRKLWGDFWHEGEMAIVFGAPGVGKSLLAVQIADAISKGQATGGFEVETEEQNVLYLDMGMGDKQFERRYTGDDDKAYFFYDNFVRVVADTGHCAPANFAAALVQELGELVEKEQAKVLIIDSLGDLRQLCGGSPTKEVELLMLLKKLKQQYNLSILLVADSGRNNPGKRITLNSLGGSRSLPGLVDSVFAIGHSSCDTSLRYLIQLKNRNSGTVFNENNVAVCRLGGPSCFVHYTVEGYGPERQHLVHRLGELEEAILELAKKEPNFSLAEIARQLGTNKMKVKRVLDRHDFNTWQPVDKQASAKIVTVVSPVTVPNKIVQIVPSDERANNEKPPPNEGVESPQSTDDG